MNRRNTWQRHRISRKDWGYNMKGLELARKYYDTYIEQLLAKVPEARGRFAAGLIGEGSQCFGYDDEISQDHDFGPGFCIWLTDADFEAFGQKLQQAYDALPDEFEGFSRKGFIAKDRMGVMTISRFYEQFTGFADGQPQTVLDWLFLPENQLAAATNGEIFEDGPGFFSGIRAKLLRFYPEDVRRKKIAARAAIMSQAGQYNLLRCIKRQDSVAATLALARFTESTISMAHLLEGRYTPFYKWGFHSLQQLELGRSFTRHLNRIPELESSLYEGDFVKAHNQAFAITESICKETVKELHRQGLSTVPSAFLQDHLAEIMDGIVDDRLRSLPPMLDCQN